MVEKKPISREEWQGYNVVEEVIKPLTTEQQAIVIKRSGFPLLSEILITNEKLKTAIEIVRSWAKDQRDEQSRNSVLLSSPATATTSGYGVGKTTIARAIGFIAYGHITNGGTPILSRAGMTGVFHTEQTAMKAVRDGQYPSKGVTIIDDIGRGGNLEFISKEDQIAERQHRYFLLIDHCYRHNRPMIMTTNFNKVQFIDCIGHASWSRLTEMIGPNRIINLSGLPDYREKIGGW